MNEFTKKELEFILDGTRHWSNQNIPTPWVFEFKKKVESMINNFCDHDYRSMGNHPWLHCIKCRRNFDYGNQ